MIDPVGLDRLLPEWRSEDTPIKTAATDDRFYWLRAAGAVRLPNFMMPPLMSNHGNFIVSLGNVCRWLATKAEALGVEIYPGFAAAEVLYGANGEVTGIATGDQAIFMTRDAFKAAGGFDDIPLMEDIALSKKLKRLGRPLCLAARARTSARRWTENGTIRTIVLMWRLRFAYWLGADPAALARRYGYVPHDS